MDDVFPKFIIETDDEFGDCLIISKCTYHNELVTDRQKVKGGGWWKLEDDTFILYGSSDEFGKATFEDIENCVLNRNAYDTPYLGFSLVGKYKFGYDFGNGNVKLITTD